METIEKRRQNVKDYIKQRKQEEKQKADLVFMERVKQAQRLSVIVLGLA